MAERDLPDRPRDDSDCRHHHAFAEHASEDVPRLRAHSQSDTELARPCADGERQHAGHTNDGNGQRNDGESSEHERVQAIRREHLRAHILERRGFFDRLLG